TAGRGRCCGVGGSGAQRPARVLGNGRARRVCGSTVISALPGRDGETVMGTHRTADEVRSTHRALFVCGVLLGLAGLTLNLLPLFAGSVAFDAAAHTGYLLALLLIGGVLIHRWWYFGPIRAFRRELGGPEGWLDRHDL